MISKEFEECIEKEDIVIIRSALLDDLIIDRTFKQFDENFEAANNKRDILVPYDGKLFETDPEKWDIDYLNKQTVALMVNFSQERINHLKNVITKVMPPKAQDKKEETLRNKSASGVQKHENVNPSKNNQKSIKKPNSCKGLTGSTILAERERGKHTDKKESKSTNKGNTLIFCGGITTAVGVAIVQPVVVGAGVVIAGVGVAVKYSN